MPSRDGILLATRIVPRLRFLFAAILLLLAAELIVTVGQLRELKRTGDRLIQSSVPVFMGATETERSLKNLLLVVQLIDGANLLSDLNHFEAALMERLSILRENTSKLLGKRLPGDSAQKFAMHIDQIEQNTKEILATKRALLAGEKRVGEKITDLESLRKSLLVLAKGSSQEMIFRPEPNRQLSGSSLEVELDNIEASYHQSMSVVGILTETVLSFDAIIVYAIGLGSLSRVGAVETGEGQVLSMIDDVETLIERLPKGATQSDMLHLIGDLRSEIFDGLGLFKGIGILQGHRADLIALRSARLEPVEAISELSRKLTDAAHIDIHVEKLALAAVANRSLLISVLAMLCAFVAIVWTIVFVLERQINRRVGRLTEAVRAIAEGQIHYEVNVTGADELGEIARALETFKLNAQELHRSNFELEKFAYVAAHDLRSPLRAIQDLAVWILEDEATVLSEDGHGYMNLLQRRVGRLNSLLTDLLEYARVGKETHNMNSVSLRQTVEEISELLNPEHRFKFCFLGPVDVVNTYAIPLQQIIFNLMGNAIKHHDRGHGLIEVTAEMCPSGLRCSVRDDGPGILPEYHNRIFVLFQTLRPRDEVEGSGLGLAIIQKLLKQYRGSITVSSNPREGRGTTFTFCIPTAGDIEDALQKVVDLEQRCPVTG